MPTREEVDATIALNMAIALGKTVYLPVINRSRLRKAALLFHHYHPEETILIGNRYGILEPKHLPGACVRGDELDMVCLPLVGFNHHGDRIGMGAGYYDRSFAQPSRIRRTHLVGLAFACQQAEFEPAAHDVPLHAVITEDGILQPERRG